MHLAMICGLLQIISMHGNNLSIDACAVKKTGIHCIMTFTKSEGNDNCCMYEI